MTFQPVRVPITNIDRRGAAVRLAAQVYRQTMDQVVSPATARHVVARALGFQDHLDLQASLLPNDLDEEAVWEAFRSADQTADTPPCEVLSAERLRTLLTANLTGGVHSHPEQHHARMRTLVDTWRLEGLSVWAWLEDRT